MAAALMENRGFFCSRDRSQNRSASRAGSVSLVTPWKLGANPRGAMEKFSRTAAVSSKVCYADLSLCNKCELSTELAPRQTASVSIVKQQLPYTAEVLLPVFAMPSVLTPATFPPKSRAMAAAPQVTEFRRAHRHPAGRQRRHHESRAPRRAGSQG